MSISQGQKILASDVTAHINNKNNPHGITAASIGAMGGSNALVTGTDFNTVTTSGIYRFNNENTNGPGIDWGQLLVMHGGGDTITQIVGDFSSGDLFTRSGNPSNIGGTGAWTTWQKLATEEYVNSLIASNKPEVYSLNVSFTNTRGGYWDEKARYTAKKSYNVVKITLTSAIEYYSRSNGYSVDPAVNQGVVWTLSPGNYIQIPTSARDPRQRFYFDGTNFIVQGTNTFLSNGSNYAEGFRETLYLEFQ